MVLVVQVIKNGAGRVNRDMATYTTQFNVSDIVYLRVPAEKEGKLVKGQVSEIVVNQTVGKQFPYVIRYRLDCNAAIQREATWLESDLMTEAQARDAAKQVIEKKIAALSVSARAVDL